MTFRTSSDKICTVKSNKIALLLLLVVSFVMNVAHSSYGSASEHFDSSCVQGSTSVLKETLPINDHASCEDKDHQHDEEQHGTSHECKHGHVHSILVNEHSFVFNFVDDEVSVSTLPLLVSRSVEAPYRPPIS